MEWQESRYKDTNANAADTHGCLAIKKKILTSAQNVKVHIGINLRKNLISKNLLRTNEDLTAEPFKYTGPGGFGPPIIRLAGEGCI